MKIYFLLPFALLIGLVVGGWGTRVDLREAKDEIKDLKLQARRGGGIGREVQIGEGVTRLLNIDSTSTPGASRSNGKVVRHRSQPKDVNASGTNDSSSVADSRINNPETDSEPKDAQTVFEDNIERAAELFEVRARLARATFIDRTGLDEEQAVRFDVLVDAMNVRLASKIETWVAEVEQKKDVGAEDGIRLVNGVTEAIVMAYDDIDRDMPEGWREKNDGDLNITDFIDPTIAMPLVRVQGKMEGGGRRNERSGRGGIVF